MKSELTIDKFGTKEWRLPSGELHRENGPVLKYNSGSKHWFLNGIKYTEQEYKYEMRSKKLKQLL